MTIEILPELDGVCADRAPVVETIGLPAAEGALVEAELPDRAGERFCGLEGRRKTAAWLLGVPLDEELVAAFERSSGA